MAVYAYKAVDLDTSAVVGTIIADTPRQARDVLREQGLTLTHLAPVAETGLGLLRRGRGQRSQEEVVALVRELATLLQAGIPLLGALQTLTRQHRGRFRAVVQKLADQVVAGVSLADAMDRQRAYFDELCVSIVRVGENTGALETALKRLAEFKEKASRLRSHITTAITYPAVVCVIGVAVSIFLMTYVVPNLLDTLTQAGKELPWITQVVKGASDFLLGWWWALLLAVGALAAASRWILSTEKGRVAADRLILRLPVIGDLVRKENTSRMAVVLAALLRSGLPFVEAVRITRQTLRNRIFRLAMDDYEAAVTAGRDVAAPLASSGVFSPMVVQMLAIGQEAGQLEDMLQQLADAYDLQVATATQRLAAVLEPFLIVLLAILVGSIAFATILPILEATNVL
jgi:type II secretory pathway component PulF